MLKNPLNYAIAAHRVIVALAAPIKQRGNSSTAIGGAVLVSNTSLHQIFIKLWELFISSL
ncbi:hypothetical protein [Coleofasciculus chthonoplastes]|uniref:hypothetical protein n=1 Tax=Coleofasciculus chthonoplastes TaxID=64178 RepID=UPI0032F42319